MGWKEGIHNTGECFLPSHDEVLKTKFHSGSVYECHQVGCGRLWQVNIELGYWQEVEREKVAVGIYKYIELQSRVDLEGWIDPTVTVELDCIRIAQPISRANSSLGEYRHLTKRELRKVQGRKWF